MATEPYNKPEELAMKASIPEKPPHPGLEDASIEEHDPYSAFSVLTRRYLTYFLGVTMILSTLTATIYFPLIPMLSVQFRVPVQAINLTITVYAIVQALAPALFASIADATGRRPILLGLVALYAAASLGLSLSRDSYVGLLILRAVQSIGGSPIPALAYGVAADAAPTAERGRILGPMLSTCNAISAVGPVIGGAVAMSTSSVRWVFLTLFIISLICLILGGFTLPETLRTVVGNGQIPATGLWRTWWSILRWRYKPPESVEVHRSQGSNNRAWKVTHAFASFRMFLYKDASAVLWTVAGSYSVYYTFQVAIPVIFANIYAYNELYIGLAFLPGLAGMTLGGLIGGKLADRNYAKTQKELIEDDFPIEVARYRNYLVLVLAEAAMVASYGWAVHFQVHPSIPIILQFFVCGVSTLLSHTASALLIDIFPDQSSTAYAAGQVIRCGISAASAAVLQPLVDAVGYGWYFTMFSAVMSLLMSVCVIISRTKGAQWRRKRY